MSTEQPPYIHIPSRETLILNISDCIHFMGRPHLENLELLSDQELRTLDESTRTEYIKFSGKKKLEELQNLRHEQTL